MRKIILSVFVFVLAFAFARSSHANAAPKTQYEISIDNFSFAPATMTVPAGATVTWINKDDVPHIVVSKDGKTMKSPVLDTDQKFSHSFARAGTYEYYCSVHPKMTGTVVVQ